MRCGPFRLCLLAVLLLGALPPAGGSAPPSTAPAAGPLDARRAQLSLDELPGVLAEARQSAGRLEDQPQVREHYEAARKLMDRQEYEGAVAELDTALNLARGDSFEVLYLLAQAKQHLECGGEALALAEYAGALRPTDPDVHYLLGRLCREQGRLEAAAEHFRAATLGGAAQPDNPRVTAAWYELGDCLEKTGYRRAAAQALAEFDRALWETHLEQRSAPEVAALLVEYPRGTIERRLELLKTLNLPAQYVAAARWAFENRPDDLYLQRLYVRALLDAGQAPEAFEFCRPRVEPAEGAAASRPEKGETGGSALLTLAIEAARGAGQLDSWIAELTADVQRGRRVAFATHLAHRLDGSGASARSISVWRALAQAAPQSAETAWDLAAALRGSGDLAGALATLIGFVRANADTAEIPPQRLEAWIGSLEQTDEFLKLVGELTARPDCDFATYTVLGMTAAAAKQTELAERLFQSSLDARPDVVLTQVAWARMLLAAYRWEDATSHAQAALTQNLQLASAQVVLGEAYAGLDEHEQAERAYKAALELRPREAGCMLALARQYRRLDHWLAAQRYAQEAWSADRTCAAAVEELIEAYLASGKLEIARACLKDAEDADLPPDTLRRIRTAVRYAGAYMGPEYLAELQRQYADAPGDVTTGLKLAAVLYLADRADDALAVLNRLPAQGADQEQVLFVSARAHLRRLEPAQAIAELTELARRYPRRLSHLTLLANACLADFRVADARVALGRILALDLEPEQRDRYRARLLATYVDFRQYDAALGVLEEWLGKEPTSDLWLRTKAQVLVAADRNDEAIELVTGRLTPAAERFQKLLDEYKSTEERLRDRPGAADVEAELKGAERELNTGLEELYARRRESIDVCVDAQRYDLAEREVRAWLAAQGPDPRLQEWLVHVLLAAKKPEDALGVLKDYAARGRADALRALTLRGRCYAALGRADDAVRDLDALLDEEPVKGNAALRGQVRQEIVALLLEAEDYAAAISRCDRWLADSEGDRETELDVLTLKRLALQRAEREDELIAVSQRLLEAEPKDPGLNNDLGYTWVERGENLTQALEMIRRAVAAEPLNPAYLDSLGWAWYMQADFEAARLYLARAAQLETGRDPAIYDHLGDAAYRLGDREAARAHWDKARELLEDKAGSGRMAARAGLIVTLRGKLLALEQATAPNVAPTAAERVSKDKP